MVTELNLRDVPAISDKTRYYDDEIFFADNITNVPNLMKLFRVNFYAFVFCLKGKLHVQLDHHDHIVKQFDGLFVDSSSVVNIVDLSENFSCKICGFNTDMGFNFINKSVFDSVMDIQSHPVIHFTRDEISLIVRYYELADFKMNHLDMNYGKESMGNILKAFAYDLLASVGRHIDREPEGGMLRQGDKLFRRFVLLLSENQNSTRSVNSFADELCVTPKYLTSVCRQHCNKTASELIALSIVGRIKQLLLYSDYTVKEVAAQLSFSNLSFFGKYVKKHLGMSPNNYRRHNGYGK